MALSKCEFSLKAIGVACEKEPFALPNIFYFRGLTIKCIIKFHVWFIVLTDFRSRNKQISHFVNCSFRLDAYASPRRLEPSTLIFAHLEPVSTEKREKF